MQKLTFSNGVHKLPPPLLTPKVKKLAFIIRGLPGSGKSYVSEVLAQANKSSAIHNTDTYFIKNGKYTFDRAFLNEYHKKNLEAFKESCRKGKKIVICDNTNITHEYYGPYEKAAKRYGYRVIRLIVDEFSALKCYKRNRHKVPLEVVKAMADLFEI